METHSSRPSMPAVILGLLGGLALVVGAFLKWVTVSLDLTRFAAFLHVSAAQLQTAVGSKASISVNGTKVNAGKIVIVIGVLCLVGVVLVFALQTSKKAGYAIIAVTGAAGAIVAALQIATKTSQINSALADSAPELSKVGISTDLFKTLFSVTWGIGLWVCIGGGVIALIGGLIGLMSKSSPEVGALPAPGMSGATVVPGAMATGFDTPAPPPAQPSSAVADPTPIPTSTPTTQAAPAADPTPTPDPAPPADATPPPSDPANSGGKDDPGSGTGVDHSAG